MTATNCKTEPHPLRRFKEAVTGGGRMKSVLRVAMLALRETMMPSLSDQRQAAVAMVLAACLIGGSAMSHVRAAETSPVPKLRGGRFQTHPADDDDLPGFRRARGTLAATLHSAEIVY